MGSALELTSWLLLLGAVAAQSDQPAHYERLLPQWLTGIIAVCGFLLLTFISFLVKKVWCGESGGRSLESDRDNEHVASHPYENPDLRPRSSVESVKENKYETRLDIIRSRNSSNIYEECNPERSDDKTTAM